MHLFIRQGWRLAGIGIIVVTSWLLIIGFLSAQVDGRVQAAPLITATPNGTATATITATITPTSTPKFTETTTPTATLNATFTPTGTPEITTTATPISIGLPLPTAEIPLTPVISLAWRVLLPVLSWDDQVVEAPITNSWTITDIASITDTVTVTETPLVTDVVIISDDIGLTDTVEVTPSVILTNAPEYTPVVLANNTNIFGIETVGATGAQNAQFIAGAGAGWTRHSDLNWPQVEPTEGVRNWDSMAGLEEDLRQASARGIKVVLIVLRTPAWAQKIVGSGCGPIRVDKLPAFANFMRDAVARYSAPPFNVKYWEIWNEPDAPTVKENKGWGCLGNPADAYYGGAEYARLLKSIYPAIKAADANSQVILGGQLGNCDPVRPPAGMNCRSTRFFEGVLRGGGGPYFDGVGFHAYEYYYQSVGKWGNANWWGAYNTTGPIVAVKARYYKRLLTTYNVIGKFLMDTESALLCSSCANNAQFELAKAYYLPEMYAAGMSEGLQMVSFYGVRSGWLGGDLMDTSGKPLPAYDTILVATSKFGSATFAGRVVGADTGGVTGVMGYKFAQGSKKIWFIRSLSSRNITLKLAKLPTRVSDPFGRSLPVSQSLVVGVMPVYIEWE